MEQFWVFFPISVFPKPSPKNLDPKIRLQMASGTPLSQGWSWKYQTAGSQRRWVALAVARGTLSKFGETV